MKTMHESGREELIIILKKLVSTIRAQRKMKDDEFLELNEKEVLEWMEYIRTHNKIDDLYTFYKKVSRRITFVFDGIVDYRELKGADTVIDEIFEEYANLNRIRLNLMDEFLLCCDKYLCC